MGLRTAPRPRALAGALLAAALAACGGGGDSAQAQLLDGAGPQTTPTATLTADTARAAVRALPTVAGLLDALVGVAPLCDGAGDFGCAQGGVRREDWIGDAAPQGVLSQGDRYEVRLDACALQGVARSGGALLEVPLTFQRPFLDAKWQLTVEAEDALLEEELDGVVDSSSADFSLTIAREDALWDFTWIGVLQRRRAEGGDARTETFGGLEVSAGRDDATGRTVFTLSCGYTNERLDGIAVIETVLLFEREDGAFPHSGELVVRGKDDALVRLVALDAANVLLEVDADGDGAIEQQSEVPWSSLR